MIRQVFVGIRIYPSESIEVGIFIRYDFINIVQQKGLFIRNYRFLVKKLFQLVFVHQYRATKAIDQQEKPCD
jgi:hypothetical protein